MCDVRQGHSASGLAAPRVAGPATRAAAAAFPGALQGAGLEVEQWALIRDASIQLALKALCHTASPTAV